MPALDFPANPTNGQVYANWVYSTSKGAWQAKPLVSEKTVTADVPPLNPADGDQWFSTIDGVLYVYVVDVDGGQWVESRSAIISDGYYSPNYVINGAFDIWQRGTSFTLGAAAPYTADRWQAGRVGTVTGMSVSQQTDIGLPGLSFAARVQRVSGNTSTAVNRFWQTLENAQSSGTIGETMTLSFWARAGANYSSASSALTASIVSGTGTDQNWTAFTGSATVATSAVTLTTSWRRFTLTGSVGSTATQLAVVLQNTPAGTAGANDWFEVTGVQLEEGSVATPFRRNANSIQGELAACQRYYYRRTAETPYAHIGSAFVYGGSNADLYVQFPTVMRTAPTSMDHNITALSFLGGTLNSITSVTLTSNSNTAIGNVSLNGPTGSAGTSLVRSLNNSATYIGFSAEL